MSVAQGTLAVLWGPHWLGLAFAIALFLNSAFGFACAVLESSDFDENHFLSSTFQVQLVCLSRAVYCSSRRVLVGLIGRFMKSPFHPVVRVLWISALAILFMLSTFFLTVYTANHNGAPTGPSGTLTPSLLCLLLSGISWGFPF